LVVVSAVLVVFVMLALVFGAILVRWSIIEDLKGWTGDVRVIAFLSDDLETEDVALLQSEITSWENVEEVVYFSKAEALEEAREVLADDPNSLEFIEENPSVLPASLRIKPVEAADYREIRDRLVIQPGVYRVEAADEAIDSLVGRSQRWRAFAVWIGFIIGGAAVVLIANTIRMAVWARREELAIMKLVGAGNWYVRLPFLLEGLFEGLVGAALAIGVVGLGHEQLVELLQTSYESAPVTLDVMFLVSQSLLVLVFGALAGVAGAAFGMVGLLKD
jgi:cell division transport system permease protein